MYRLFVYGKLEIDIVNRIFRIEVLKRVNAVMSRLRPKMECTYSHLIRVKKAL